MGPLLALACTTLLLAVLGRLGVRRLRPWHVPVRGGLAVMFTMTAAVHFVAYRDELIAMVPPALPFPGLLVTITGILEFAGALGLLYRRTVPWAAAGLSLLLLVMLPANIYAALEGLTLGGDPATPLVPRILQQCLYLAATLGVLWAYRPLRTKTPVAAG